jgi:hypothetical protein
MPPDYAAAYRDFRRRVHAALTDLRREISARETELRRLRDEEVQLAKLAGHVALPALSARLSVDRSRVNWREVLIKPEKISLRE